MSDDDLGQGTLDLDEEITIVVPFLPIEVEQPTWHLEPFSGKETRCSKCQSAGVVSATYHAGVAVQSPCYAEFMTLPQRYQTTFPEHIDRRCPVCNYAWTEGLALPGIDGGLTMPVTFSRGMPERTTSPPFEAGLLPLSQKEELCRDLLTEFGITNIRERAKDHELIHACLIDPSHQHQDSEPTASLNYEKLVYRCLGCQAKGGLLWLIATVRGTTGEDARRWLNLETGLGGNVMDLGLLMRYFDALYKPKVGLAPIPQYPDRMLEPWNLLHPYLTDPRHMGGRAIPEANVLQMRLGYAPEYKIAQNPDGTWVTSERITIPHFWKGALVGWQSRRLDPADGTAKYLSSAEFPKDQTVYNYAPRHTGTVVVMEAMLSAVSKIHLDPHPEATFGAGVTDEQVRLLSKHPKVVLFMDNDEAGWKAVEGYDSLDAHGRVLEHHDGLGDLLGRSSVVFVVENPWAADPQDISDEDYLALVANAVPYSIWRKPTTLLCYRCSEVAHEGPCQERG